MFSFLEPPTSAAEEQVAETLRERYRLLGEEADARAARARWKRRRSERARSARSVLKAMYTAETRLWMAESAAAAAAGTSDPVDDLSSEGETSAVFESERDEAAAAGVTEPSAVAALPESDGNTDGAGEGRGTFDGSERVDVEWTAENRELSPGALPVQATAMAMPTAMNQAQQLAVPASDEDAQASDTAIVAVDEEGHPDSSRMGELAHAGVGEPHDDARIKFSHVTITQEPGGKSTGVARALGGGDDGGDGGTVEASGTEEGEKIIRERRGGDEDAYLGDNDRPPALKFSHVTIIEEPGGSSAGVSQALGGAVEVSRSGGGSGGSSREPGANASHVPHTTIPDLHTVSGDKEIGDGSGDGTKTEPERTDDGLIAVGEELRPPVDGDTSASAGVLGEPSPARVAEEALSTGSQGSVLAQGGASESEGLLEPLAPSRTVDESCVEGGEEGVGSREGRRWRRTVRPKQGIIKEAGADGMGDARSIFPDKRRAFSAAAAAAAPNTKVRDTQRKARSGNRSSSPPLPLEVVVRRCVRDPVLAQCRAVDSAALTFLVHGAGAVAHLASLRMFLLGLNSGFLHEFTLRLLEGLYDGG